MKEPSARAFVFFYEPGPNDPALFVGMAEAEKVAPYSPFKSDAPRCWHAFSRRWWRVRVAAWVINKLLPPIDFTKGSRLPNVWHQTPEEVAAEYEALKAYVEDWNRANAEKAGYTLFAHRNGEKI